jgi:hypothetical protein
MTNAGVQRRSLIKDSPLSDAARTCATNEPLGGGRYFESNCSSKGASGEEGDPMYLEGPQRSIEMHLLHESSGAADQGCFNFENSGNPQIRANGGKCFPRGGLKSSQHRSKPAAQGIRCWPPLGNERQTGTIGYGKSNRCLTAPKAHRRLILTATGSKPDGLRVANVATRTTDSPWRPIRFRGWGTAKKCAPVFTLCPAM